MLKLSQPDSECEKPLLFHNGRRDHDAPHIRLEVNMPNWNKEDLKVHAPLERVVGFVTLLFSATQ
jgi:hypothetical protein